MTLFVGIILGLSLWYLAAPGVGAPGAVFYFFAELLDNFTSVASLIFLFVLAI